MKSPPRFDDDFRRNLDDLFQWRRDVRSFRPTPISEANIQEILNSTTYAPSVGLSEPWRIVKVDSLNSRKRVYDSFLKNNAAALATYRGAQAQRYANLKLEGLTTAPLQLAICNDLATKQGHQLGRQSMPETLAYSCVMAIHTMWLSARARGIGLGWVSILDPNAMSEILDLPPNWQLIAYLCLGYPLDTSDEPTLQREGWQTREEPIQRILFR